MNLYVLCCVGLGVGGEVLRQCFNRCCPVDLSFVSYKSSFIGQFHIKNNTILR